MRLFIDDERSPIDYIDDWNASANIDIWAKDSMSALRALKWWYGLSDYPSFITIYFDHDLGEDDTTMPVVDWLAMSAFDGVVNPETVICIVHTQNPVGRDNIKSSLQRWGYRVMDLFL